MITDLVGAAERIEQKSAAFASLISTLEERVRDRADKQLAKAMALTGTKGEQDADARAIARQFVQNQARREAGEFRRQLIAESEVMRNGALKEILAIEAGTAPLAPLFESPVQVLSRYGLGTPERSRYHEQLSDAGPGELTTMKGWALHTGDKILGAAVLSRVDRMPAKARPFDQVEFAQALVGDEFDRSAKALARIRVATQRSLAINRSFERGRMDPMTRLSLGLAQRSIQ